VAAPEAVVATNVIAVRGIGKTFPQGRNRVEVLRDIDLTIPRGAFVTLFGPSGCGKSTLLRLLAGLQEQDSGDVSLFGSTAWEAARRKEIAWIPQSSAVLPWRTVRGNALLSRIVNRAGDRRGAGTRAPQDVDEALGELGLGRFEGFLPRQLSGGMRQRTALARGFVQGAPLMLMDEPFSALDEFTRERARRVLLDAWEQHRRTVVMVTHSATEAVLVSDLVVVMTPRPGRIRAVVPVDLPRPRGHDVEDSTEFLDIVRRIKAELRAGEET
jgi:NitT/TauT family transport system ATP-binding protein